MIAIDTNLLIYAHVSSTEQHPRARAQVADLALWSLAPGYEANLVPGMAEPWQVVAMKAAGIVAVVAGAAALAHRGYPVIGRAVLLVGSLVGLAGAASAVLVLA